MKKYLMIIIAGVFTTAVVTATVTSGSNKRTTKKTSKCCMKRAECAKAMNVACY